MFCDHRKKSLVKLIYKNDSINESDGYYRCDNCNQIIFHHHGYDSDCSASYSFELEDGSFTWNALVDLLEPSDLVIDYYKFYTVGDMKIDDFENALEHLNELIKFQKKTFRLLKKLREQGVSLDFPH